MEISPGLIPRAYRIGYFPMAESRDGDRVFWLDPERRGSLPLDAFHLPRRLARNVLSGVFEPGHEGSPAGVAPPVFTSGLIRRYRSPKMAGWAGHIGNAGYQRWLESQHFRVWGASSECPT
jgi:hypothetical protein